MGGRAQASGAAAVDLAHAHMRMLADSSLQFQFRAAPQPKPPTWAKPLLEVLTAIAPVMQALFWIAICAAVGLIVFFIGRELIKLRWPERFQRRPRLADLAPAWRPTQAQARALLEDVDALAARGRFAEAAHLLLHRSIADIQGLRPRLVRPALTSRDIAALPGLPEPARDAFSGIAQVVERSHFGGAPVGASDFARCRRAYEAFAFPEVWA